MWLGFIQPEPLMREIDPPAASQPGFAHSPARTSAPTSDHVAALTDVLVAMRETIERQASGTKS